VNHFDSKAPIAAGCLAIRRAIWRNAGRNSKSAYAGLWWPFSIQNRLHDI